MLFGKIGLINGIRFSKIAPPLTRHGHQLYELSLCINVSLVQVISNNTNVFSAPCRITIFTHSQSGIYSLFAAQISSTYSVEISGYLPT